MVVGSATGKGAIDTGGAALVATVEKQPHAGGTGAPLGTKGHRQYVVTADFNTNLVHVFFFQGNA